MQVSKLERNTLTTTVSRELKRIILDGEINPGDVLPPQPELASRLGVGLSTLREAIKGLALLGVLIPEPGRGTLVGPDAVVLLRMADVCRVRLEDMGIHQLHEARMVIETSLVTLAAERAHDSDIRAMNAALADMRRSVNDPQAFIQADIAFHLAVAQAADNPLLQRFYEIVLEMVSEALKEIMEVPHVGESFQASGLEQQEQVFFAIRDHRSEDAVTWLQELNADWEDFYLNALSMNGAAAQRGMHGSQNT